MVYPYKEIPCVCCGGQRLGLVLVINGYPKVCIKCLVSLTLYATEHQDWISAAVTEFMNETTLNPKAA